MKYRINIFLQQNKYLLVFVLLLLLGYDLFMAKWVYDCFIIFIVLLWFIIDFAFGFEYRYSLVTVGLFWGLALLALLLGLEIIAEKSSIWTFVFFTYAVFKGIYEFKHVGAIKLMSLIAKFKKNDN